MKADRFDRMENRAPIPAARPLDDWLSERREAYRESRKSERQKTYERLTRMARERRALADWYERQHGHIYAQGLRQCAQNDDALAAMFR